MEEKKTDIMSGLDTMDTMDSLDRYNISIFNKAMKMAPFVGLSAALTMTLVKLAGFFDFASIGAVILFDCICCSYFLVAWRLKRRGIVTDGKIDQNKLFRAEIVFDCVVILQWNIISYVFPASDLWGFAPMFVLLTAFLFHTRAVVIEILGLTVSIAVSWIILPEMLLPSREYMYTENLVLRIVALIVSFTVIYVLTSFAEKFTIQVRENAKALEKKNYQLELMNKDIIDFAADIIEQRDATSGTHVKRVKSLCGILAGQMAKDYPEYNLNQNEIDYISMASALHDIGKIGIPDNILLKPGRVDEEEYEVIKTHAQMGASIIDKLPTSFDEQYRKYCREICLYHHERWDGKGYPCGLKEKDIPVSAQIVAVVDCFDALTSERPYKNALPGEMAVRMIIEGECGAFSEDICNALIACKEKFFIEMNRNN